MEGMTLQSSGVTATSCSACLSAVESKLYFVQKEGWTSHNNKQLRMFELDFESRLVESHSGTRPSISEEEILANDIVAPLGMQVSAALRLEEGRAYQAHEICDKLSACEGSFLSSSSSESSSIRITPGHAERSYGTIRVSRISMTTEDPDKPSAPFDYASRFLYRWTDFVVETGLIEVTPGTSTDVGITKVTVPKQGQGITALWIADPCFSSAYVSCIYADLFQTSTRTPALVNTLSTHFDHWAIWGDNFYDFEGYLTNEFFAKLSKQTQSRLFLATSGNHDYWIDGSTDVATQHDQYGNGFMQFYAMDATSALESTSNVAWDFSVNPDSVFAVADNKTAAINQAKAAISNFVFWTQIGNLGYIVFSSAYSWDESKEYMTQACAWASEQVQADSIQLVVLAAHWSGYNDGAKYNMDAPGMYQRVINGDLGDACLHLAENGVLKFIEGHTHCNAIVEEQTGWMVAAQGMSGCGQYAFSWLDTRNDRAILLNFPLQNIDGLDQYDEVYDCITSASDIMDCASFATVWLNQTLI
eukprot:CAMPEP_0197308490 /NCGR_PEP_ID=MMETSP0891-20130614/6851_1 /TAXON_ID=44058 ORGANISM="Aureoumbra lagunensis, Strain CCMP1510" /NCGR_SAMPLE_ID=MMETSP0891 /ASSEMBLY_ACC=CAM_ASM_000534 /LENGTH=530 /DNA_ID=CAMNT_0042792881 /DNA_START=44 /DNA_END=1636 /DNA_ORIENTATION=+